MTTVTLLAGLQGIDRTLYEAAAVDGASAWSQFWNITLPQLRTVIVAITSLDLIWNFNSFGLVYVLTAGGPGGKTMLPMLFAYNEAFRYGNFGMAAAMGDVMVVIIIVFLAFYLRNRLQERGMRTRPAARALQYVAVAVLPDLPRLPAALADLQLAEVAAGVREHHAVAAAEERRLLQLHATR